MEFQLNIKLGNDAMRTRGDVAETLIRLGKLIAEVSTDEEFSPEHAGLTFHVRDLNGNAVGCWGIEKPPARRVVFTFDDDFAEIIEAQGIDPNTVTDDEWRQFENMFFAGTEWADVAETAAQVLAGERDA
jgi:hypothetical protein